MYIGFNLPEKFASTQPMKFILLAAASLTHIELIAVYVK
jgi:hypothetical protein